MQTIRYAKARCYEHKTVYTFEFSEKRHQQSRRWAVRAAVRLLK